MKTELKDKWAILIFGLGLITASISFWIIPYSEINMTGLPFIAIWSITGLFVGAVGVTFLKKSSVNTAVLTTAGFLASVLIRIVFELALDSTTHNLFPFEIILTILLAFPSSFLGAITASFLLRRNKQQ